MSSNLSLFRHVRNVHLSMRQLSSQLQKDTRIPPPDNVSETPRDMVATSQLKKRVLVWGGAYERVGDVPEYVPRKLLTKSMDKFRVRFGIVLMIICGFGSIAAATLGRGMAEDLEEARRKVE